MGRKFLTIEDLYQFCKTNNFSHFNSKEFDSPIILQSFEEIEFEDNSNNGLCPVKLKACHIGRNANKSSISKESMQASLNSFRGRPILGAIIKLDSGEYDFHAHDVEFVLDENGETEVQYIEIPVGVTNQNETPTLEYDETEDKTYVMINGNIFEDYSKAADIMRRRRTAKCSVEIAVEEMSYDSKQDALSIDKFYFTGVTILGHEPDGTEIQEGMKGSKITIDSFSASNNSMNYQDKMIEVLDRLNMTLSKFNIIETQEKGVEMMESEVKVVETEAEVEEAVVEEGIEVDPEAEVEVEEVSESEIEVAEEYTLTFKLSHDDIRAGLYALLNTESDYVWIVEVYDNKFIYQDYNTAQYFKRTYSVDGDNISLGDKKDEVFSEWLTQEEKDTLAAIKADYVALKEFKDKYDAAEVKAKKDEIFGRDEYEAIRESDEFKALMSDAEQYSVEEIETKCDLLYAAHEKAKYKAFAAEKVKKPSSMKFSVSTVDEVNSKPYGDLFD